VVAPVGTVATIVVVAVTVKLALVPLNVTVVGPKNCVPVIVTLAPGAPLVGVTLVIVGVLSVRGPMSVTLGTAPGS
jgi:hypothetical protein